MLFSRLCYTLVIEGKHQTWHSPGHYEGQAHNYHSRSILNQQCKMLPLIFTANYATFVLIEFLHYQQLFARLQWIIQTKVQGDHLLGTTRFNLLIRIHQCQSSPVHCQHCSDYSLVENVPDLCNYIIFKSQESVIIQHIQQWWIHSRSLSKIFSL